MPMEQVEELAREAASLGVELVVWEGSLETADLGEYAAVVIACPGEPLSGGEVDALLQYACCLLYTSPSPRDRG